ncbi:TPA: hypothetical protein DCZ46_04115 [Candidatus Campbellbacteria bacterium]|uniref:Uncharacterized protein n=2 Tax=Candidatus Campbelliibacteriota TaxID=1752727 RepID=A0A1F5EPM2_9BACT|nr:MAG: protein of unknown function with transmembrane region [Candidatus Campbellbacteria bacterium GW2011_OD1_34_28]KKP75021.1 MAG: hypothetical protein UR74_C0002G0287 [Candidatus Campbellbacteria bacterium GW2011_GWD2_35_24]KKP75907.1 MAG: hypothetical protein UR75_C0002G0288 [Candidatus Campbellbacteria bacterium GW2011_GWC2_35_28]KKP76845.1 MAG: hypothetical protein UR76_C0002G0046 [Candidatus Campbellbacteria bacterium GW2011_GWC1_35_31]KKP78771.1 MAG: hypothetical protein UR79_C0002G004
MNKIIGKINRGYFEKTIFWSLVVPTVILSIFYAYFVKQTIINIVERENFEDEIVVLNSEIGKLEFDYIALKNEVNIDYAHSIGFVNVREMKFASRAIPTKNLSLVRE